MKKVLHKISSPGEPLLKTILKLGYFLFTRPGIDLIIRKSKRALEKTGLIKEHDLTYTQWISDQNVSYRLEKEYKAIITQLETPLISIFVTVNEYSGIALLDCLFSVANQIYSNWELCICCYQDNEKEIRLTADEVFKAHHKFVFSTYANNGEYLQTLNEAAKSPEGKYILVLDQNEELTPNCLFEIVKYINLHPNQQVVYADHDKGTWDTQLHDAYFKPDWSPDTLLAKNYIGPAFIISTLLWKQLNGLDVQYATGYTYDLLLRAAEQTTAIGHISKILFHINSVGIADEEQRKLIEAALKRRNITATVVKAEGAHNIFFIDYAVTVPGKVSIIIPTRDNVEMLKTTLDSIIKLTKNTDYEIILLNNNSSTKAFFDLVAEYEAKYKHIFRCIDANFPFNFAKLMNVGTAESTGNYLLMLNNDVEVLQEDWLQKMMGYAQLRHIGAVGVKLLFPDNTIQHAGVVLGVGEAASHAFINLPNDADVHFNAIQTTQNFSAVTAACLMVRKDVYEEVGGMDEELPVEFNDIDFCLKLRQHGCYNVYLPNVALYHYESATRGHPFKSIDSWKQHERDLNRFRSKWGGQIYNDPFYNPNLTTEYTDYRQKKRMKT